MYLGGGWGVERKGKSGAYSGIFIRGAPCIGEGSGVQESAQWGPEEVSPPEAPGN